MRPIRLRVKLSFANQTSKCEKKSSFRCSLRSNLALSQVFDITRIPLIHFRQRRITKSKIAFQFAAILMSHHAFKISVQSGSRYEFRLNVRFKRKISTRSHTNLGLLCIVTTHFKLRLSVLHWFVSECCEVLRSSFLVWAYYNRYVV